MKTKTFLGVTFRIDRPKGYVKTWDNGKSFTYPCDYGYFPGYKGEDGEGLDAFVEGDEDGHFEVFQKLTPYNSLDETKYLVGVSTPNRETIYRLYGDEIHARRTFKGMEQLMQHVKENFGKEKETKQAEVEQHPDPTNAAEQAIFGPVQRGYERGKAVGRAPEGVLRAYLGSAAGTVGGGTLGYALGSGVDKLLGNSHPNLSRLGGTLAGSVIGSHILGDLATRGLLAKESAYKEVLAKYKLSQLKAADIDKLLRGNIVAVKNDEANSEAERASDEDRLARMFKEQDSNPNYTGAESGLTAPIEGGMVLA